MFNKTRNSLAAAGIAALAATTSAQAGIITVEVDQNVSALDSSHIYDLDGDSIDDIKVSDGKGWSYGIDSLQPRTKSGVAEIISTELSFGDAIPELSFDDVPQNRASLGGGNGCCAPGTAFSSFAFGLIGRTVVGSVSTAYFGVRFKSGLDTGAPFLQGWLEFSSIGENMDDLDLRFVRYAYEDTGGDITVGQTVAAPVSAPAAGGLLVAALAGLGLTRRRQRKTAKLS